MVKFWFLFIPLQLLIFATGVFRDESAIVLHMPGQGNLLFILAILAFWIAFVYWVMKDRKKVPSSSASGVKQQ